MSYKVEVIPDFERDFKKIKKKYPSLKQDLAQLIEELKDNPKLGTSLGRRYCYKIRLAISSKSKGKSGGARVITQVYVTGKTIYLLSIYDKSEKADLTKKELDKLLKGLE